MIVYRRAIYFILLFILSFSPLPVAGDKSLPLRVDYDSKSNQLVVIANDVMLKRVLANIALKTGMEILMDPDANRSISANLKDKPLEKSLKVLLRGTSYVFIYKKDRLGAPGNGKTVSRQPALMAVRVLLSGENDTSKLQRVVALPSEALQHALATGGLAAQRWQERRNAMPKTVQEKLDAYVNHRLELKAKNSKRITELKSRYQERRRNSRSKAPESWGSRYGGRLNPGTTKRAREE